MANQDRGGYVSPRRRRGRGPKERERSAPQLRSSPSATVRERRRLGGLADAGVSGDVGWRRRWGEPRAESLGPPGGLVRKWGSPGVGRRVPHHGASLEVPPDGGMVRTAIDAGALWAEVKRNITGTNGSSAGMLMHDSVSAAHYFSKAGPGRVSAGRER